MCLCVCVCVCACAQMFVRVGVAITQTKFKLNCAVSLVEVKAKIFLLKDLKMTDKWIRLDLICLLFK